MRTASEFSEIVDALFDTIMTCVDGSDAADAIDDVELNQGVLEISALDRSKIIVNRHAPTQEIWVAARSGGYHFRWADDGNWIDTRSGESLPHALSRVIFEQTGARIDFSL